VLRYGILFRSTLNKIFLLIHLKRIKKKTFYRRLLSILFTMILILKIYIGVEKLKSQAKLKINSKVHDTIGLFCFLVIA